MISWKNYHEGQTSSPYTQDGSFAKASNIDIWGQLGIARVDFLPKAVKTGLTNYPTKFTKEADTAAKLWTNDGNSLYQSNDEGETWAVVSGGSAGSHPTYWKNTIICPHGNDLDAYKLAGTTWVNNVSGANIFNISTSEHFVLPSKMDDKVYVADGAGISVLEENTGQTFDPASAATFTFTQHSLPLPDNYNALCLAEQRENLIIGTIYGATSSPVYPASIFIWDRERNEYDYQISVPENAINSMCSIRDRVFVSAGNKGRIYEFSEAGMIPFVQLPFDYDAGAKVDVGRNSMSEWNGKLIVGTESVDDLSPSGIFQIDIDTKKISPVLLPSTGDDASTNNSQIGGVLGFDTDILLYGHSSGSTPTVGIDRIENDLATQYRWTGYSAYIESPLFRVGTERKRGTLRNVEIFLARKLTSGQGVRLKYRENINDSWTTLGTFDSAGHSTHIFPAGLHELRSVQLRVELTTGASSTTTPYLQEVRLT